MLPGGVFWALALGFSLSLVPLVAETGASESVVGGWQLESLTLVDGTRYAGLVLSEGASEWEFAEIVRPPGRPMFAVIRPLDAAEIESVQRLEPDQRRQLEDRFARFRARARIEAGRMRDVHLEPAETDQGPGWAYRGTWFRLESTADQEMTRRTIVRVEQVFRAYRQVLPAVREPAEPLRIVLLGDMSDYRRVLESWKLDIANPAFYSPVHNRIVVGTDLNVFSERLEQIRTQHAAVRRKYDQWAESFPSRLAEVLAEMRARDYDSAEIEMEARARRAAWEREYSAALTRLEVADRKNIARFAEVTRQSLARLYHEAFHAYAENFVYPREQDPLTKWLDEGLAQIFETAQLDGDTLRIDAPDPLRLAQLQEDLAGNEPWAIADVLNAPDDQYLTRHEGDAGHRLYLYAWGLTWYLIYNQNLLYGERMDRYVRNPDGRGPVARFEELTDMPLEQFEPAWHDAMRNLNQPGLAVNNESRSRTSVGRPLSHEG